MAKKKSKATAKKAAKKSAAKKAGKKAASPAKPGKRKLHTIVVVSASDRNEARRALAEHFKVNGLSAAERHQARRGLATAFKSKA